MLKNNLIVPIHRFKGLNIMINFRGDRKGTEDQDFFELQFKRTCDYCENLGHKASAMQS